MSFEAGRDVHTVAKQLPLVDDNIAKVDADTKVQTVLRPDVTVYLIRPVLDRYRGLDGSDRAREVRQDTVARRVDHASQVVGDYGKGGVDMLSEGFHSTLFVMLDVAAIASNVGGQDRRQSTFRATCHRTASSDLMSY